MVAMKKRLQRLLGELSGRDLIAISIPLLFVLLAGFWAAAQFIKPAPPDTLVISTGSEGGAYERFAARYKTILARYDIELVERPSRGSAENFARLLDGDSGVDVAFIQGGTAARDDESPLAALGSLYYEPLWVFYRGKAGLDRLDALRGKRLAIGGAGSGTRTLSMELLTAHGLQDGATRLVEFEGLDAARALVEGEVDAVFVVGAAQSASVWLLLHSEGIALLDFSQADAYTRRLPYLSPLTLPAGVINLERNIPPASVRLVAPVATMVARKDLHPALTDLLLQAMTEVHREPGLFQAPREFPGVKQLDLPLSDRAERYYRNGPPFLQRYLPFWAANFLDRILVMLLPLLALLIPTLRIAPSLYAWRVKSRIYRWYGELKFLEMNLRRDFSSRTPDEWLTQLAEIEDAVNEVRAPLAYTDFVYTLRSHIALVRKDLLHRRKNTV
jgi:TRAP transporter TAXI family solute receptor